MRSRARKIVLPRSQVYAPFGFVPEYHSVGTTVQTALELIDVDTMVSVCSSRGRYMPLRGAPVEVAVLALWVPRWIEETNMRITLIDATHVGFDSLARCFQEPVINYWLLSEMFEHVWESHWMVSIPARCIGPLNASHKISLQNGDVIYIAPGPLTPFCHYFQSQAFGFYQAWGADVAADGVPEDLPGGPEYAQLVHDGKSCLIHTGRHASDSTSLEIAERLISPPLPDATLIRPADEFYPLVHRGLADGHLVSLAPEAREEGQIAVFLDLRNITQESSVRILGAVLGIAILALDGYCMVLRGGQRFSDHLELYHGCVLRACVVSVEEVFSDDSSRASSDLDTADAGEAHEEHDSHDNHLPDAAPPGSAERQGRVWPAKCWRILRG